MTSSIQGMSLSDFGDYSELILKKREGSVYLSLYISTINECFNSSRLLHVWSLPVTIYFKIHYTFNKNIQYTIMHTLNGHHKQDTHEHKLNRNMIFVSNCTILKISLLKNHQQTSKMVPQLNSFKDYALYVNIFRGYALYLNSLRVMHCISIVLGLCTVSEALGIVHYIKSFRGYALYLMFQRLCTVSDVLEVMHCS